MTNDFIKIQRDQSAATEAADFLSWLRDLRSVYERGLRIRAKMQNMFDDSGGSATINWATLQTNFGVPSTGTDVGTSANGQTIYTLVDGAVGAMQGSFQVDAAQKITERVG